jgi:hypothetical protein
MKIQAKRVPDIGLSILLKYLSTLTGLNLKACESFEDAVAEIIAELESQVPAGLDEAIPYYTRVNIKSAMWGMKEKDTLVQSSLELMFDDNNGMYWLMTDATMTGKDSLFLVSCMVADSKEEATTDNIVYMTQCWAPLGKPANIISGACKLKDGSVFSAVAVQLSSIDFIENYLE